MSPGTTLAGFVILLGLGIFALSVSGRSPPLRLTEHAQSSLSQCVRSELHRAKAQMMDSQVLRRSDLAAAEAVCALADGQRAADR